jgi:predicted nuclease with TOPRIM domain
LIAQLEHYSQNALKSKRSVEEETLELSALQGELDRIAETFRRSYGQRQQLIIRWETIIDQMQQKDHCNELLAIVRCFDLG